MMALPSPGTSLGFISCWGVMLSIDADGWNRALPEIREHYRRFGDEIPAPLVDAVDLLERNLQTA